MELTNFEKYNKIHDTLIQRLEDGYITVEQAKEVNDLAFDKYITESGDRSTKNIKAAYNSVLENIQQSIKYMDDTLHSKEFKNIQKQYDENIKNNPEIKNTKFNYKSYYNINEEYDDLQKNIDNTKYDEKRLVFNDKKKSITEIKPEVKTVIGLNAAIAVLMNNMNTLKKMQTEHYQKLQYIDRAKDSYNKAYDYASKYETKHGSSSTNNTQEVNRIFSEGIDIEIEILSIKSKNVRKTYDSILEDIYSKINDENK